MQARGKQGEKISLAAAPLISFSGSVHFPLFHGGLLALGCFCSLLCVLQTPAL